MSDIIARLSGNGEPWSFAEVIAEIERLRRMLGESAPHRLKKPSPMTITHDQIPPEVVEAAEHAFTDAMLTTSQPNPIRAAIAAGLAVWPGAEYCSLIVLSDRNFCGLLLPVLPQKEPGND